MLRPRHSDVRRADIVSVDVVWSVRDAATIMAGLIKLLYIMRGATVEQLKALRTEVRRRVVAITAEPARHEILEVSLNHPGEEARRNILTPD